MPDENSDPDFEAFVERVMELKRILPEAAAWLAELDAEGNDLSQYPGLSGLPPLALEYMRQFNRGELTEGEMFHHVAGVVFP